MISEFVVRDVLRFQEVLYHNLVNFFFGLCRELVLAHIEVDDLVVSHQTAFECWCVALFNAVARDIELLNLLIVCDVLRETLAEHVSEEIGSQIQLLKLGVLDSEIDAHLGASFVIKPVQLQVQVYERCVDFESLAEVTRTFVVNLIVGKVQMGEDLGLK